MTNQPGIRETDAPRSATAGDGAPVPDGDTATPPDNGVETLDTKPARPEISSPTEMQGASEASHADDHDDRENDLDDHDEKDDGQEAKASAQEFATEHDPAKHDVAAGEGLRQRGDWTADEAGGPQVWDDAGNLVEGTSPAQPPTAPDQSGADEDPEGSDDRRTSSLDEVRDGGYSVGSAAPIEDGAVPLGHPVKAWEDTKTFVAPDHPGYLDAEPDLWFTDDGAAQRAGFRPAD